MCVYKKTNVIIRIEYRWKLLFFWFNLNINVATVDWLVRNGANLLHPNVFGQHPEDMALANHFPELADQIRRDGMYAKFIIIFKIVYNY